MTTPKIDAQKRSFFQDRKMWFWIAAGSGLVTLIVLVIFLQALISTTKYYVLSKDVAARTLITQNDLVEQVVSSGGEPPNAIDISRVATEPMYSKTALKAGDILTDSNAGELIPLRQGIPDDFVVASFSADPNSSAGGNIKRGDYVDVFYVGEGQSSLLFQRVLILDTTTDLNTGAPAAEAADPAAGAPTATEDTATATYRGGVPFLYTVGLKQNDALKLSAASSGKFYVVLSSEKDVKAKEVAAKTLGMSLNDVLSSSAGDSGKGTDNSFGEKKAEEATATPSATPAPSAEPTKTTEPAPEAETQSEGQ
jgi:hypothetical protein